jgi:hypothetical protein
MGIASKIIASKNLYVHTKSPFGHRTKNAFDISVKYDSSRILVSSFLPRSEYLIVAFSKLFKNV